ncbi:MAG: ribonuclease III [Leptospira sp.]|nr:ribonuclease III [Leptospira sp.]
MKKTKAKKDPQPTELPEERFKSLQSLSALISIKFRDLQLLNVAFTHSSYFNEMGKSWPHNERLEYLGDSVLGLLANEYLYTRFENYPEGKLAKIKARIVSEEALSRIARDLSLGKFILLGKGEKETGGADRASNQANVLEALLGAIYLDQGLESCRKFIIKYLASFVDNLEEIEDIKDYKTILQEYSQKKYKAVPVYKVISETGPDHDKIFTVHVFLREAVSAEGFGKNKRKADQAAAHNALRKLKLA